MCLVDEKDKGRTDKIEGHPNCAPSIVVMPPKGSGKSTSQYGDVHLPSAINLELSILESTVVESPPTSSAGDQALPAADPPPAKNTHRLESEDEDPPIDVAALLKEAREVVLAQTGDFYLGTQTVRSQLQWYRNRRHARLVANSALANAEPDDDVPSAILSIIVHITKRDCWLAPDAGWTLGGSYGKKFADIKLTFTGCAPSSAHAPLVQDFNNAISNLTFFMNAVQTQGAEQIRVLVPHMLGQKIKFRHGPFAVCYSPFHVHCRC